MKYAETKAGQLFSMMKSFAAKHALEIEVENHLDLKNNVCNSVVHVFKVGWKPKDYMFNWDEVESLSEGAAYIFADIIDEFRLNRKPVNHNMNLFDEYARNDLATTLNACIDMAATNSYAVSKIQDVIFNDPATIVKWADGTKTVTKTDEWDVYDPEKGLAMAIAKKALGNKGSYYNEFKKWLNKYNPPMLYPDTPKVTINFDGRGLTDIIKSRLGDIISDVNKSIEKMKR